MSRGARGIDIATYNIHAGVDGWSHPFDVLAACQHVDADVLVLQEVWTPTGRPSIAAEVAGAMGYDIVEHVLATGRLARPGPRRASGWGPTTGKRVETCTIFLDRGGSPSSAMARSSRYREAHPGSFGIALLSRIPITAHKVLDLGQLRRDACHRAALVAQVELGDACLTVVGTHMSHLTKGSIKMFVTLREALQSAGITEQAVLAGDMNLWGPPLTALMPGWRRAAKARTWPAHRPHSQIDHILVTPDISFGSGEALDLRGSDHRPLRVPLFLGPPRS